MVSMAVKQMANIQESQLAQLFPLSVGTDQSSLNYMRRLTAVAISNILYLRNVFTEDCYGHRKLDHLKLRILTERCETLGAKRMVQWVKGCFDAMEKKYLKQLTLGIYTDPSDPEELIEAYTFRFTYDSNQVNCNISLNQTKGEIRISEESATSELRNATVQLLRSLIIMTQSLDKLPTDCYLTMKLLYYDEITPQDYEPPGFMATDRDTFTFNGRPVTISAGEVITPYHSLKVKIRTNQEVFKDMAYHSDKSQIQELEDQCSPLQIDDSSDVRMSSQHLSENMGPIKGQNLMQKNKEIQTKSSKSFVKQLDKCQTMSTTAVKENTGLHYVTNSSKLSEKNVISKLKDMNMEDNHQIDRKRAIDINKRKYISNDFEVTQDSVFNSQTLSAKGKRFKVSNSEHKIKR